MHFLIRTLLNVKLVDPFPNNTGYYEALLGIMISYICSHNLHLQEKGLRGCG